MRSARLPALAISIALSLPVVAASPRTEEPPAAAAVRQALSTRFPDISIVGVQPAPVAGLFEVFTGDAIAYSNASGDYLLLGTIMDTHSRHNCGGSNGWLNAITPVAAFAQAIKVVKATAAAHRIFADPECPYRRS
jgi:thiol:disulfide interchange protein DsbC